MLGRLLCVRGCVVEKVDDREQRRDEDEKEEEGGFLYTPRLSTYSSWHLHQTNGHTTTDINEWPGLPVAALALLGPEREREKWKPLLSHPGQPCWQPSEHRDTACTVGR